MNLNIKKLNKYRPRMSADVDALDDDDSLAPVMPAIDAVQQLIEEENRIKKAQRQVSPVRAEPDKDPQPGCSRQSMPNRSTPLEETPIKVYVPEKKLLPSRAKASQPSKNPDMVTTKSSGNMSKHICSDEDDVDERPLIRNHPLNNLINSNNGPTKQDEYEFIPKSVILDVYSNDPEVERFLKQLTKVPNETGYDEQDYKCFSCRRPVGLVFGQSRSCNFDGHHYCSECHLNDKSVIPARILCNWDFNKYVVAKRNQHFLNLISNEPMFELKKIAPLLHKMCPELRQIEELRRQAFFIRSYCITCVQDSISFELTKLIWPREHLIKQTDVFSLEDLVQVKSGALKLVLKNVINFGRQHVLSCVLCCQRGFICELCKSSQIIYPFDTESVYRCNSCQSTYHQACFKSKTGNDACPRCYRLKARREETRPSD